MGLSDIKPGWSEDVTRHCLEFEVRDRPGSSWSFECDAEGKLAPMQEPAQENYDRCVDGTYDVIPRGIVTYGHTCRHPAEGKCVCGRIVVLDSWDVNDCECGRLYNMSGSEVRCSLRDIDPADAGEVWDDD